MKMSQFITPKTQVAEGFKELTASDFKKINDVLARRGGVMTYSAVGAHGVKTDGDKTLRQSLRGKINEASALNDVTIADMEDKKTDSGAKTADQLEVGAEVIITGNVQYKGKTGIISRFGSGKKFVVVSLHDGGDHSFHSSDVSQNDYEPDEDEEEENEDDGHDTFYVAFYDEDEERAWIGLVSKRGGGKWHERQYKGKPEYRWGQSYMSYLTPNDIMTWIHKDYRRGIEIEGPFFDASEAEHFVEHNWGALQESTADRLNFSLFEEWAAASRDKGYSIVNSAPIAALCNETNSIVGKWNGESGWLIEQVLTEGMNLQEANAKLYRAIKNVEHSNSTAGGFSPSARQTIRMISSKLSSAVGNRDRFFKQYNELHAEYPDEMDYFVDELFIELKIHNIEELADTFFPKIEESVTTMDKLDAIASGYGKPFYMLEASIAAELVDFAAANELAPHYGKNKFWTLSRSAMSDLINEHPEVVTCLITEGNDDNPSRKELEKYRRLALRTVHEAHNLLRHIAEEELVACKVNRIAPIGSVTNSKKFKATSDIDVAFYADCNDKPREPGLQEDLSHKLQDRLIRHPLDNIGVINSLVFHEPTSDLQEEMHDSWDDLEKWKTAVKNAYPEKASKMRFKAKIEAGHSTISAEIPGEDRSYGVWDVKEKTGIVLGESKES